MTPRPFPAAVLLAGALLAAVAPSAAAASAPATFPTLTTTYGADAQLRLPLRALDPARYRVVRRPSASTIVVHHPATRHCSTTTLRLRTVRDERDPQTWVRENTPPSDLAFETLTTATVPGPDGLSRTTHVVSASRMLAGIVNGSILSERVVAVARVRGDRLAVLSQTSRTLDLARFPSTACGGVSSFTVGPAFAEIRTGLVSALERGRRPRR